MKKHIFQCALALAIAVPALTSCYEDTGNYDYISDSEAMPVVLGQLDSVTVRANSVLTITPKISGDDNGHFSYLWYTISKKSYNNTKDTLSQERELNATVNLREGNYTLYYQVTNDDNGVYRLTTAPLTVTATDITTGWYVMKEVDGGTDFDYFSLSGKSDARNCFTDVMGLEPMKGKPVGIMYQSDAFYGNETTNADGTTTVDDGLLVLHFMTDKDLMTVNASDLSVLKTLDEQFYELPEEIDFGAIFQDDIYYHMIINNGKVHTLGTQIGKWGFQAPGDYDLMPNACVGYMNDIVYDRKNNRFCDCGGFAQETGCDPCIDMYTFMECTEFADSLLDVSHFLNHRASSYTPDVYLVAKSGISGKHYVVNVGLYMNYINDRTFYEVPEDSKLLKATVLAAPLTASVIYYADANNLYMYRVATGESRLVKSFAAGESISFIKNIKGTEADGTSFNDVVVITNTASAYNVYRFPMVGSAGELNTDRAASFTGTGKASYLMFR